MPETNLRVKLLNYTKNGEETIAQAGKLCYSPVGVDEISKKQTEESIAKYVKMLSNLGHLSPIEHISFTFAVEGVFLGFDEFFTLFHEALFPGDSSWLFNPILDPIINVLPEEYFLQCFVIFFIIYEGLMVSLTWLAHKQLTMYLKNKE